MSNAFTQEGVYPPLREAAIALEAHFPCKACDEAMVSRYPAPQLCPEGDRLYRVQIWALKEAIARLAPH